MHATLIFLVTLVALLFVVLVASFAVGYGASRKTSGEAEMICDSRNMAPFWTTQAIMRWTPATSSAVGPLDGFSVETTWNSQVQNTASGLAVFSYDVEKNRLPAAFTADENSVLRRLFAQPGSTSVPIHLVDSSVLVRYAGAHMSYVDVSICLRAKAYPKGATPVANTCDIKPALQTAFFGMRPGGSLYMQAYYPDLDGDVLPLELFDKRDGAWLLVKPGPKGTPILGGLRSPFTTDGGLPTAAPASVNDWQDAALPTFAEAQTGIKKAMEESGDPSRYNDMLVRVTSAGSKLGIAINNSTNSMWPFLFFSLSLNYEDPKPDDGRVPTPTPTHYTWRYGAAADGLPDPKTAFQSSKPVDVVHRAELFPYDAPDSVIGDGAVLIAHGNRKYVPRITVATMSSTSISGTFPYTPLVTTSLETVSGDSAVLGGLYAAPAPSALPGVRPDGAVPYAAASVTTVNPVDWLTGDAPTAATPGTVNTKGLSPTIIDSTLTGSATSYTVPTFFVPDTSDAEAATSLTVPTIVGNSSAVPYNRFALLKEPICPGWTWTGF